MNGCAFASAVLLIVTSVALGQTPPAKKNPIDRHLQNLETRIKSLDSFIAKLERRETAKDGSIRVLHGEARFLTPGYAALQMIRQDNPNLFEMYILSTQHFYEYRPQTKEILYRKLDAADPKNPTNMMAWLSSMTGDRARQDYDWKLVPSDEKVIHLVAEPKANTQRRDFNKADLVIVASSMLPQTIRLEQVNGNVVEWKITSMDLQTPLKPADFAPPQPPGWKLVDAPRAPAGRNPGP